MQLAVNELKVRSKKLLKEIREGQMPSWLSQSPHVQNEDWQLKHCQTLLARRLGFKDWHHAKQVLSGSLPLEQGADFGTFWYENACGSLVNLWFAHYAQAREMLSDPRYCLYPYKHQFVVAEPVYADILGLPAPDTFDWQRLSRNLLEGYPSEAWDKLALVRLEYKLGRITGC
ncbi:hypothetical protein [Bowmanella pacifica]|uniref:Uncharacterized protein n=1 Tax=Bowmanella pacifica TaxID=502051 RepID=A0A917YWS9_9ALTE|nr:hypothetical protein [Bowmanella pacifica]GGO68118.1 hypothetical protein GCM10010982_16290 [Bowmanella pacifica]